MGFEIRLEFHEKTGTKMPTTFLIQSPKTKSSIFRKTKSGKLRRLGHGFYTTNFDSADHHIIRRHWSDAINALYPTAVLTGASAMKKTYPTNGSITISTPTAERSTNLPGLRIIPHQGPGPDANDYPIKPALFLASPGRTICESIQRPDADTTLNPDQRQAWIKRLIYHANPRVLYKLEHQIDHYADSKTAKQAKQTIHTAFATQTAKLSNSTHRARSHGGNDYDYKIIRQCTLLRDTLQQTNPQIQKTHPQETTAAALAFYEAYFSNYIEGTEFALSEARRIIYTGKGPTDRPADRHFIDATFQLATDAHWHAKTPNTADEFLQTLSDRNFILMENIDMLNQAPGEFKKDINCTSGGMIFVSPEEVEGTLLESWPLIDSLQDPFHRAILTKYIITAVHPFEDGNGRTSRLAMNAELDNAGLGRIIIPSALRYRYLTALRAMEYTHPQDLINILQLAHQWTSEIDWSTWTNAQRDVLRTRATQEYDATSPTLGSTLHLLSDPSPTLPTYLLTPSTQPQCTKIVQRTHAKCQLELNHKGHCRSILPQKAHPQPPLLYLKNV